MSYQKISGKVYYHVLKGSRFIFADEINKKKLLDIVLAVQEREDWLIYAFCLTDDAAYFVTEAAGKTALYRGMRQIAETFLKESRKTASLPGDIEPAFYESDAEELRTLQDIVIRCRQVHRLPLEKGYVRQLNDYWWSSYITYTGIYEWHMVNCQVFLLYFSADPDTARKKLRHFHSVDS